MLRPVLLLLSILVLGGQAQAFCGFYAAKLSDKLFNKASAVIIARSGTQTVITMASDVQGSVKDFAMIVPVPVVLKKQQIRLADPAIFDKLKSYSSPRLVEYYDANPCNPPRPQPTAMIRGQSSMAKPRMEMAAPPIERDYGVTIVEQYSVGEYDILILSAEESGGLEAWLTKEGYKIPAGAAEVLEPYIKSEMKFFVVKVNLERQAKQEAQQLRPIQMTFRSEKFMLPIRLGMANAEEDQEMLVYGFAPEGRIETANYRTVAIPSDVEIPNNLKPQFDDFYGAVFEKAWKKAGKDAVMLEYAWNLSAMNPVKCDPCNGPPPIYNDMREAGVFWLEATPMGYTGEVYFTRLHVRYNRKTFPQDLLFQATPNRQNFQGRYVMRHPAPGDLSCAPGQQYLKQLRERRQKEVVALASLTGWDVSKYDSYVSAYDHLIQGEYQPFFGPLPEDQDKGLLPIFHFNFPGNGGGLMVLVGLGLALLFVLRKTIGRPFRRLAPLALMVLLPLSSQAFCGFYVARAEASLFNKSSSVILVRDGNRSVVTMSSDFDGPVKDFAMVIPVPEVLERDQIRIVEANIFDKLDAYSGPRLVQYYDPAPCQNTMMLDNVMTLSSVAGVRRSRSNKKFKDEAQRSYNVTIVESYTVGEYDIVILSARESDGLQRWLTDNGYQIPKGAAEVLEPYIKSRLKFFVVKVNLENFQNNGYNQLRPIQISYRSNRFMLPIRLGMANAQGDQDLIVYAFTRSGRIESTNYRTVPIPTNWEVPNDLRHNFGAFYAAVFDKSWQSAGRNAVHLEYAWDLSGIQPVKCDPCNGPPPVFYDLQAAGVDWLRPTKLSYAGSVFMTRLHVRYNRTTFPQDLQFQITPNQENFQGRYVMHQPAPEHQLQCEEAQSYLNGLQSRRKGEVANLAMLTGWETSRYQSYLHAYDHLLHDPYLKALPEDDDADKGLLPFGGTDFPGSGWGWGALALGLLGMIYVLRQRSLRMLRFALPLSLLLLSPLLGQAFCGFYVAKADAKLFNKASAVIIARQGTQTVITMSSDFEGPVKDFAMIVPVPVVLKRNQIRLAEQSIFDKLDAYSGPRLVEYYDENPCYRREYEIEEMAMSVMEDKEYSMEMIENSPDDFGVTILESYSVGEYDILILSAEESGGLETWLKRNGYQIPAKAAEVLEPYIKSDMKFFVVKVNLEKVENTESPTLRPIQMTFRSDKFMLPIRLGMANANGDQDMIVYAFGENGRIETANYRTVEIPSNQHIPLPIQPEFGQFYLDVFQKAWAKAGKNGVMLEYAWDLSSSNYVKCDPCSTTPPTYAELREAGVFWVTEGGNNGWGGANYQGNAFLSRLHVRYNRSTFPQDLQFQLTPNKTSFQGRYVLTHPATGDLSCNEGQAYLKDLRQRREQEVAQLYALTGWDPKGYDKYVHEFDELIEAEQNIWFGPLKDKNFLLPIGGSNWFWPGMLLGLLVAGLLWWRREDWMLS